MPRIHCNFRIEEAAFQVLEDYAKEYNLDNHSKALQRILLRFHYLDRAHSELLQNKPDDEALACISRIRYDGSFWCVYKPPRMRELETLDICIVCKKRNLGLTEKSLVRSGAQTEPSPRLNMVSPPSTKTPFSYAPDRPPHAIP